MTTLQEQPKNPQSLRERNREMVKKAVKLAEASGCQLRPTQKNPSILRGICPFHYSTNMQSANTLQVDTYKGSFQCQYCKVGGTMAGFAAMIWGMAVPEAFEIINTDPTVEIERPVPMAMREPEKSQDIRFRTQNSFLLTKASNYFCQKLNRSHEALSYLARLGISKAQSEHIKIGYTDGWGLIRALRNAKVSEEEIAESTLMTKDSRGKLVERYERVLTIPHLDAANHTSWFMMMPPASPETDEQWAQSPRRPIDLWGKRPYMMGTLSTTKNEETVCITDDPRVFLVVRAHGLPAIYTMDRKGEEQLQKVATRLRERQPWHLSIACYDQEVSKELAAQYEKIKMPKATMRVLSSTELYETLEPANRNMSLYHGINTEGKSESKSRRREDNNSTQKSEQPEPETTS